MNQLRSSRVGLCVRCLSSLIYSNCETASKLIAETFTIKDDFISEEEEINLVSQVEPLLKRYKYEDSHIDHVIKAFKEIEVTKWNSLNKLVIERVKKEAFKKNQPIMDGAHVIDLADDGFIMPHVDSIKYCGSVIAGLSLLSDSVMRFTDPTKSEVIVDAILRRKSLYIMQAASRYDYKHAILSRDESIVNGEKINRSRRISIICRCEPNS